jgi:hypothetical protein
MKTIAVACRRHKIHNLRGSGEWSLGETGAKEVEE